MMHHGMGLKPDSSHVGLANGIKIWTLLLVETRYGGDVSLVFYRNAGFWGWRRLFLNEKASFLGEKSRFRVSDLSPCGGTHPGAGFFGCYVSGQRTSCRVLLDLCITEPNPVRGSLGCVCHGTEPCARFLWYVVPPHQASCRVLWHFGSLTKTAF